MEAMARTVRRVQLPIPTVITDPRWGLLVPLMLAGNVVAATVAWVLVGLVMR
jgi:hypothetical protein